MNIFKRRKLPFLLLASTAIAVQKFLTYEQNFAGLTIGSADGMVI